MPVIVGVALGGAFGASARYVLDRFIEQHTESVFPWSTFAINATGCFVIGLVIETLVDRHHLPAWIRIGIVVGVLGGYTTFSTYVVDITKNAGAGAALTALLYMSGTAVAALLAVWAGNAAATAVVRRTVRRQGAAR